YGYAKVSKSTKATFQKFITEYFEKREQLVSAFVLVDIRHEAQKIDIDFINYLGENGIPFGIIFTKADKIGKTHINKHVAAYKKELIAQGWEEIPPYFVTSSESEFGKEDVLNYIDNINQELFKNKDFV
ncbi:MAG TPA: hypothetical protein VKZ80_05540, partial [Flavobacterium sp.]|nr:hypothetical protein [Flavobacterium sp.]